MLFFFDEAHVRIPRCSPRGLPPLALLATALCLAVPAARGAPTLSQPAPTPVRSIDFRAELSNPDFSHAARNPRSGSTVVVGSDASIWRRAAGAGKRFEATEAGAAAPVLADLHRVAFDAAGTVALAVGNDGLLLRSTDDGVSWRAVPLPAPLTLRDLLALPQAGTWLVAASDGRVLRSTDGGLRWQVIAIGPEVQVNRLVRTADGRVWAVGEHALLAVSDDDGQRWSVRWLRRDGAPVVGLFEGPDGLLLAASGNGRILRSDDGGQRWLEVQTPSRGFTTAMLHDERHGHWVAVTHQGDRLWSRDAGLSWRRSGPALGTGLTTLHHDPVRGSITALGHGGVVQTSSDGGRRWQAQPSLPHRPDVTGMSADPEGWLAWGRWGALYSAAATQEERDRLGRPWKVLREPQPEDVTTFGVLPGSEKVLAAGTAGWMTSSDDGGHHWQAVPMKFMVDTYPTDFRALAVLPDGRSLLATGPTGSIMRSDDAGRRWRSVMHRPFETAEVPTALVASRGGAWLVPEMNGAVYRSTDAGHRWQRQAALPQWAAEALLRSGRASPHDGTVLLAGKGQRLWRSVDEGARWQSIDLGGPHDLYTLLADDTGPRWWAAGTDGTLLYSTDMGQRWRRLRIEGDPGVTSTLLTLARTGAAGGDARLLAAGRAGVIALSDDGEQWRRVPSGTEADLRVALRDPRTGAMVLVGRQGTVLRSTDHGKHWETLFSHTRADFSAAVFLSDGSLLAAGQRLVRLVPQR